MLHNHERVYRRFCAYDTQQGTVSLNLSSNRNSNVSNDLDILVTLRKGTRSGTMHHISKYALYHRLSNSFRTFTTTYLLWRFQNLYKMLVVPK